MRRHRGAKTCDFVAEFTVLQCLLSAWRRAELRSMSREDENYEKSSDHRHHRARTAPTWPSCCSTRAMRCTASSAAARCSTPTASTTSTRTRTIRAGSLCLALRRHDGFLSLITHHPGDAARRDLQPGRAEPCAVQFEEPEYTANADALGTLRILEAIRILGMEKTDALLSGLDLRALRQGAGDAADGDHAVLSALALRGGQALRLLDHGQLPRGLWHVRLQRHPLQPRVAAARRDLRDPQDHPRRWRASRSACRTDALPGQSGFACATGAMPGTTSRCSG